MNHLEKQVLRLIGENVDSPDVFQDTPATIAPVRDSITDAIEELIMVTGGYTETVAIPLVSGKGLYRLNFHRGTFAWVKDAWLCSNKRRLTQTSITRLGMIEPRWMEFTGTPAEYFFIGTEIVGFWRKPSSSSDVVEMECVVIPAPYTSDAERVKLRQSYERYVVQYAVAEYHASRGDAMEAERNFAMYVKGAGLTDKYSLFQDRNFRQKMQPAETQNDSI